jgi:cell division protein FtsW (lipid II flippase)
MQLGTDVGAMRTRHGRWMLLWPTWVEAALVVGAIALMLPSFERVAALRNGRDARFADTGLRVAGLPEPVLPTLCAHALSQAAERVLRSRACPRSFVWPRMSVHVPTPPFESGLPPELDRAAASALSALVAPLDGALTRLERLRAGQRDGGDGDVRAAAYAVAAIEAEVAPYVRRYRLNFDGKTPGLPALACARRWVVSAGATPRRAGNDDAPDALAAVARGNALLLLGAALDGRTDTAALADAVLLPESRAAASSADCGDAPVAALATIAAVMDDARQSLVNTRKNEAMRALLPAAGAQWAAAMGLGYGLLLWSRRRAGPPPAVRAALALALWTLAAWAAAVPWPFAGARVFEPARRIDLPWPGPWPITTPAGFVLGLFAMSVLLLAWAAIGRLVRTSARVPAASQAPSSRLGYPGMVVATGLGAVLLLDLSANAHPLNRYLALYHQGHLWVGLTLFSLLLFARQPLARGLGWTLLIAGEALRGAAHRLGFARAVLALLALASVTLLTLGVGLANLRQLTSELGRVWLIVGTAWFFFLRGGPLAERLARSGRASVSVLRYLGPLAFVVAMLLGAMLATRDMGPLLIAGYAAGAFLAAAAAMWWHLRSARLAAPVLLALGAFGAWIAGLTFALLRFGRAEPVTAARLESLDAPLASVNDQAALVSWFQRATPDSGFGVGNAPWCGFAPSSGCTGLPAQIHSDYTFTALYGVFGPLAAWTAVLGGALWLHRLVRHHGSVTRGEPRLIGNGGRLDSDGQPLLSWIGVVWVTLTLCQLAVTVTGNLAVLPLTGVTFPFVSFGLTSLLVNLSFLALCINVDLPPGRSTVP